MVAGGKNGAYGVHKILDPESYREKVQREKATCTLQHSTRPINGLAFALALALVRALALALAVLPLAVKASAAHHHPLALAVK